MSGFKVTDMGDELPRWTFWLGEAYFWLFMAVASWAALSSAPWWVAFGIGGVLTLGNIIARWGEWRALWRYRDYVLILLNWGAVLAWQSTVIVLVFLVARYLRRFAPEPYLFRTLDNWWPLIGGLAVLALAFGVFRIWADRAAAQRKAEAEEAAYQAARKAPMEIARGPEAPVTVTAANGATLQVSSRPIGGDTLYVEYHTAHALYRHKWGRTGYVDLDKAESSAARIKEAEVRLGVTFPDAIRACYATQNGGSLGAVFFEHNGAWEDAADNLLPLEALDVLARADEMTPRADYPHPDQTLILADCDAYVLLVDLITGRVMHVAAEYGMVDTRDADAIMATWPDWDTYLGALRRVALPAP